MVHRHAHFLFLPALLLASAALTAAEPQPDPEARAAILAASRAFSAAYVRNDSAALADAYTADAVVLPPGRTIRGREAAAKYFQWGPRYRQIAHSMDSEELSLRGDTAIDVGTWTSSWQRGDEAPATASGRYLAVWVREADGKWRLRYDMWHRPEPSKPEARQN
jgi:ketosteroid isomerase-like protein